MTRVLVVDDHAVVRRGVLQILRDELRGAALGEASSADEALRLIRAEQWDVVVLDIAMPGRSGLDALQEIVQCRPSLRVLILSMHPEDQMAVRVLKAGASGYLTKDAAPRELVQAVRSLLDGERYVSPSVVQILVNGLQGDDTRPPHETLSNREFEILRMITAGSTVTEIAGALCLSAKTVSTYRARILDKLHLHTTAELIHYGVEHDLSS